MFAIAPTNLEWFQWLDDHPPGDIVNFWTPTPWKVKRMREGDRLYFMMKAPIRKIGGYGTFVRYIEMTASDAWDTYGLANGAESRDALIRRLEGFAKRRSADFAATGNPLIGCIELTDVVTLDKERFVIPSDLGYEFPRQVVKLKYFEGEDHIADHLEGAALLSVTPFALIAGTSKRKPVNVKDRKGRSEFRRDILNNYGKRCCVTSEAVEQLLEAAHIQPYVNEESNHGQNGLCLRVDIHRLFDEGLIAISTTRKVLVSPKLNGTSYMALNGADVRYPSDLNSKPSEAALKYHRDEVFR